jgi:hypothetical protein
MYTRISDSIQIQFNEFPPSFPSALQLRVTFGLLNNLPPFFCPSEADCQVFEQFYFYGVKLLASRTTPNLEDQGIHLRLAPTGMGDSTSTYATAVIALRVSGAPKPHHHDKVETPSVGTIFLIHNKFVLMTVATGSKARNIFARSNTGIVVSNPIRGMDVRVSPVFVLPCVGIGIATG